MSNNIEFELHVDINEDITAVSLLTFHYDNIEEYEKQDMVINIKFEVIVPSIKINPFISRWLIL